MALVSCLGNQEGGVGKSASAAALTERGGRTLTIECDPHAGVTRSLGIDPDTLTRTTYDAIFLAMLMLLLSAPAYAAGGDPVPVPTHRPSRTPRVSPESRYNEGLVFAQHRDWPRAETAYRDAIRRKAAFPEAWNGLGHALKSQKKFDESIRAYQEALRLRPNYAQALEYLGEAYVAMGKTDEARAILDRLTPLDAHYAEDLARVIRGDTASW